VQLRPRRLPAREPLHRTGGVDDAEVRLLSVITDSLEPQLQGASTGLIRQAARELAELPTEHSQGPVSAAAQRSYGLIPEGARCGAPGRMSPGENGAEIVTKRLFGDSWTRGRSPFAPWTLEAPILFGRLSRNVLVCSFGHYLRQSGTVPEIGETYFAGSPYGSASWRAWSTGTTARTNRLSATLQRAGISLDLPRNHSEMWINARFREGIRSRSEG
jgi:hypothetical protein